MAANFAFVALFASCCLCVSVLAVPWKDCGSEVGKPSAVSVTGCADTGTCELHKGVNASFGVDFASNEDADKLKLLVWGHIAGVDVPFPIDNPDGCKGCNISCPVKGTQTYGYRNFIYVKKSYPSITLVVKLKLVDANGKALFCVMLPAHITSSPAKMRADKSNSIRRFTHL